MPDVPAPHLHRFNHLRVAIVHYWFVGHAGAERVVEEMVKVFPQADLYTLIVDRDTLTPLLAGRPMKTSFLQRIPGVKRFHRHTLALQPLALEQFDLRGYDLVISSESGPAKGVLTSPNCLHVCYCHSPMRYLWDMYAGYVKEMSLPTRIIFALTAHRLRIWDYVTAARVDAFAANSSFISKRIWKFYRRPSEVIFPPVAASDAYIAPETDDYYLWVGRLVGYKRADLAVAACSRLGRKLRVIGSGPELAQLKSMAGPTIEFLGFQSDEVVHDSMARCRAFLCPTEEDFGIAPVEVQAFGRPVIAYGAGGALDTVRPHGNPEGLPPTGVHFTEQTEECLMAAIKHFEENESHFDPVAIRAHALTFDSSVFRQRFAAWVSQLLDAPPSSQT